MTAFDSFIDLAQKNPQLKNAVQAVVDGLQEKLGDGTITEAEIEPIVKEAKDNLSKGAAFLGLNAEQQAAAVSMLDGLKDLAKLEPAKATEFLNGFDALLAAENEAQAEKAKNKVQAAAPPDFFQMIIGFFLKMFGFSDAQIAAFTGAGAAPAAPSATPPAAGTTPPGATPSAGTGAPTAGGFDLGLSTTGRPRAAVSGSTPFSNGLPDTNIEGVLAHYRASRKADIMGKALDGRSFVGHLASSDGGFKTPDMLVLPPSLLWSTSESYRSSIPMVGYDGIVQDLDLERTRANSSRDFLKAHQDRYEQLGLKFSNNSDIPWRKGDGTSTYLESLKAQGREDAQNRLQEAFDKTTLPTFTVAEIREREANVAAQLNAARDELAKTASAKENILVKIAAAQAGAELAAQLGGNKEDGSQEQRMEMAVAKGRTTAGAFKSYTVGFAFNNSADADVILRKAEHEFEKNSEALPNLLAQLQQLEAKEQEAIKSLTSATQDMGRIEAYQEALKPDGIIGKIAAAKEAKEAADKKAREEAEAKAKAIREEAEKKADQARQEAAEKAARKAEADALKEALGRGGEEAGPTHRENRGNGMGGGFAASEGIGGIPEGVTQVMRRSKKSGEMGEPRYRLPNGVVLGEGALGKLQQLAFENDVPLERLMGDRSFLGEFKQMVVAEQRAASTGRVVDQLQFTQLMRSTQQAPQSTPQVFVEDPMQSSLENSIARSLADSERRKLDAFARAATAETRLRTEDAFMRVSSRQGGQELVAGYLGARVEGRLHDIRVPELQRKFRELTGNLETIDNVQNSLTQLVNSINEAINDPQRNSVALGQQIGALTREAHARGLVGLENQLGALGKNLLAQATDNERNGNNELTDKEAESLAKQVASAASALESDQQKVKERIGQLADELGMKPEPSQPSAPRAYSVPDRIASNIASEPLDAPRAAASRPTGSYIPDLMDNLLSDEPAPRSPRRNNDSIARRIEEFEASVRARSGQNGTSAEFIRDTDALAASRRGAYERSFKAEAAIDDPRYGVPYNHNPGFNDKWAKLTARDDAYLRPRATPTVSGDDDNNKGRPRQS